LMRRLAQSSCIPALREGGELRPEAPVVILLGRAFPSVGSSRSPIKILAAVMINRAALATPMIRTGKAGFMGKREPQMILKTDERSIVLELGHEGTFVAQIKRLRSKPAFRRGDKLEVAVKNGR
jgi:hypothetical protein